MNSIEFNFPLQTRPSFHVELSAKTHSFALCTQTRESTREIWEMQKPKMREPWPQLNCILILSLNFAVLIRQFLFHSVFYLVLKVASEICFSVKYVRLFFLYGIIKFSVITTISNDLKPFNFRFILTRWSDMSCIFLLQSRIISFPHNFWKT